jgi:hypothetical protein
MVTGFPSTTISRQLSRSLLQVTVKQPHLAIKNSAKKQACTPSQITFLARTGVLPELPLPADAQDASLVHVRVSVLILAARQERRAVHVTLLDASIFAERQETSPEHVASTASVMRAEEHAAKALHSTSGMFSIDVSVQAFTKLQVKETGQTSASKILPKHGNPEATSQLPSVTEEGQAPCAHEMANQKKSSFNKVSLGLIMVGVF